MFANSMALHKKKINIKKKNCTWKNMENEIGCQAAELLLNGPRSRGEGVN